MAKKKKADKHPADEALHAEEAQIQTTFEGKVNKYGFIHLSKRVREAWGVTKGTEQPITIELTDDNALIIRKA
jgi:hypothetical protein